MAGTKEGSLKAAETNRKRHGDDFYSKIGSQSWKNPERSHVTGFAKLPKEKVIEYGRKGGSKTKEDYKTKTTESTEVNQDSTGVS